MIVNGSAITSASARLTRATCTTCSSIDRNRWITPMPPARAIAMAIGASVTVSMLADTTGAASDNDLVNRAVVSTSPRDAMGLRWGTSRTSS